MNEKRQIIKIIKNRVEYKSVGLQSFFDVTHIQRITLSYEERMQRGNSRRRRKRNNSKSKYSKYIMKFDRIAMNNSIRWIVIFKLIDRFVLIGLRI